MNLKAKIIRFKHWVEGILFNPNIYVALVTGAVIGGITGGLVGLLSGGYLGYHYNFCEQCSFYFPQLNPSITSGAVIGAVVGAAFGGAVTAAVTLLRVHIRTRNKPELSKANIGAILTSSIWMGVEVAIGMALGAIIGSLKEPGLGSALGALIGTLLMIFTITLEKKKH